MSLSPLKRRRLGLPPEVVPKSFLKAPGYCAEVACNVEQTSQPSVITNALVEEPDLYNVSMRSCFGTSSEEESVQAAPAESITLPWDWKLSKPHPVIDLDAVQRDLEHDGAAHPHDLLGITVEEAKMVYPTAFENLSSHIVERVLAAAKGHSHNDMKKSQTRGADSNEITIQTPPNEHVTMDQLSIFAQGVGVLRKARLGMMPCATDLAHTMRKLHSLPKGVTKFRWTQMLGHPEPPALPAQRAAWLSTMPHSHRELILSMIEEDTIWFEMAQWHTSADSYASAIQLWGRAALLANKPAWPPSQDILNVFVFLFRNGDSLANYISSLRSVLTLLRSPLGVLRHDATGLVEGIRKLTPLSCRRVKQRATAEQTKRLARVAKEELFREDVGESWVVARHYCLRYGAEVIPMEGAGMHSKIEVSPGTAECARQVSITLYRRKLQRHPVVVVRRCICQLQGKQLCGVCILQRRWTTGRLFPSLEYSSSLAMLKTAAALAGLGEPLTWGTHAFRRGWADESLKHGGPTALFYSGGWRGVSAFAYVQAQTRGALSAAEWLIDFSESDDDE